ncbi:MAG: hypothetical protein ACOCUY_02235 [Verrucomicrobiota bacterium]
MSLINDALKEAKAQSAHSSLPPDLAEKIQEGGFSPAQNNDDSNNNNNDDSAANGTAKQKPSPKKQRKGGTRDLAVFAVIFLLLLGGLLTAGYFLFPSMARKAGLDKAPDEAPQPAPEQASAKNTEPDNSTAESATEPVEDQDSSPQTEAESTESVNPEEQTESKAETAAEATPESGDPSRTKTPDDDDIDADATAKPASTEPQSIETAAEIPKSIDDANPETNKPQPAPPDMRRAFHLSAIVGTASRRMAVINGGIVQAGDTVNDITIVSISRRRMIIKKDGSQYILRPSTAE